jgi:hypothetical protein
MKSSRACMSVTSVAALAVALSGGACSGGKGDVGAAGDDGGVGAGQDATSSGGGGCATNTDCASQVPPTAPAGCATGKCDALQGTCTFVAKDNDGDGDPTANCKASNGVPITDGTDCNDDDPNIYGGHPETCTDLTDGGTAASPCSSGQKECLPDGTESACTGTLVCVNQACVGGKCVGSCGPGETQCSGNNGLQTCGADGTWGSPVQCMGGACLEADAGTGSGAASCGGVCSPGATQCGTGSQANYVQTCDGSGEWQTATNPCTDVCSAGQCGGNCSPGQTECGTSNNVLTCPASGTWPTTGGTSCTSQGKACVATGTTGNPSAACSGSCVPGVPGTCGSCGKGTETCTASGTPGTCKGDPPVTATCGPCNDGTSSCGGPCQGGTTNVGSCGTCGGTNQCGGTCSRGPAMGSGGPTETVNLDFNTSYCHANSANFAWTPSFVGQSPNPSGTYTVNYSFTDHNNMSGSFSTVFYIGCSGSPTAGNPYSEAGLTTTQVGSLVCPVGQSVVWYPTVCGQSGSCCGDPSVNWNITGWTSSNAVCVATP